MIIDLAASGFEHLVLDIDIETSPDEINEAWASKDLPAGHPIGGDVHYVALAGFRKRGSVYRMHVHVVASPTAKHNVSITYYRGGPDLSPEQRSNLDMIGKFLQDLSMPCSVSCHAGGDFSSVGIKPMMALPLVRFSMPHSYFDEVRGIRLAKLVDGVDNESVGLDLVDDGQLRVFAQARYDAVLDSSTPAKALRQLVKLKNHAVILSEAEA